MVERITCEVMYLVHECRDIQDAFNSKFDGDAYINFKTEQFRRFIQVLNHDQNINDIKVVLNNFLVKSDIDYELMQSEYVERLHEWLKRF